MKNLLKKNDLFNKEFIKSNEQLIKILDIIKPLSFILYGSFAKNKQNLNSDIDFLIIFKKNIFNNINFNKIIYNLKKNISQIFNRNIDLVVMIHHNKLQYHESNYDPDTNFIYNIYHEGYYIYGKNEKDLIIESVKYAKF
jgi:predicted nucleotidyltransferase